MVVGHSELMGGAGETQEIGGVSGGSSDMDPTSTSIPMDSGGSRWPRQEALALIKIRSDMDPIFKDASLKAPLWEQVSRKMGELGFQRSAKKCREKFENVYKYHKRTKDGRASKSEGKTYRFFDQLEALEKNPIINLPHSGNTNSQFPSAVANPTPVTVMPPPPPHFRFQQEVYPTGYHHYHSHNQLLQQQQQQPPSHIQDLMLSDSTTMSSSSSSSSEEEMGVQGRQNSRRRRRKKKWKDYLEMMMRQVIEKQEEKQKRLLENLEQREMDRIAKEEAWRQQEMARINREHDLLVRERSLAAAKDAAMISFLEKITNNLQHSNPQPVTDLQSPVEAGFISRKDEENGSGSAGGCGGDASSSSSRWPKAEVEALINLRTNLDLKYHDGAPKGPLWEEISAAMAKIGYNRSSKRCKEKWENINKYYKKVKETNKKRPEDSKTCPYFHKLEALHQRKMEARNNVSTSMPLQWPQPLLPLQQQRMYNGNVSNPEVLLGLDEDEDDEDDTGFEMIRNHHNSSPSPAKSD